MNGMSGRLDQSIPVGTEAAGVVTETGSSETARALKGKKVAVFGSGMYSQFQTVAAERCMVLPEDVTTAQGAAAFVNPMTALGMIDTMRREGHKALIHTAGASNLGLMLQRLCWAERIDLVNIVRSGAQENHLRSMGATWVCNTQSPHFIGELNDAVVATEATIAFDAIGGGRLAGDILRAMEAAAGTHATIYSRYSSTVHEQVCVCGGLDRDSPRLEVISARHGASADAWSRVSCSRSAPPPLRSLRSGLPEN